MRAFAVQVKLKIGENTGEAVGVVATSMISPLFRRKPQFILARLAVQLGEKKPSGWIFPIAIAAIAGQHFDGCGLGQERAHLPRVVLPIAFHGVRTEHTKRVAVEPADDRFNFGVDHRS